VEFNYFIGIEALEKIAGANSKSFFVRDEAKRSAVTLKTLLNWHINKWEEEKLVAKNTPATKGSFYRYEQETVGKLLQSQKKIFTSDKKTVKKY